MAIIKCPECGKEVSTRAEECPHCGYPLQLDKNSESKPQLNKVKPNRNRVFGISSLVILLIGLGVCWSLGLFSKILPALSMGNDDVVEITQSFTEAVHQFEELYPFSEGMATVRKNGKFGFINIKGELVIPCQYLYAGPFKEGLACVVKDENNLNISFVDKEGNLSKTQYIFNAPYFFGTLGNGYIDPELLSFQNGVCEINYADENVSETQTVYIDKKLKKIKKPSEGNTPKTISNEYEVFSVSGKDIYGDEIELKGLKDKDGKIIIPAKYNNLQLSDNGVALATMFVEDAESHLHPYKPFGLQIDGYVDFTGKSTFTEADKGKLEGYKGAQLSAMSQLKLREEEQARLEEEQRQKELEARGPEWLQGSWECKGTVDYGRYLGGVQRFTARVIITSTNLKVYYDGDLAYSGSYEIEGGEIKYNRKNGSCDVIPLDYSNERLEFGDGKYYSKISSSSNSQSYSSNSYNHSFGSANDVLSYTSSKSFYNSGDRLQIKFDAVYLNGRALTGAPRVTSFSNSSATVVANSPYGGGGALHFYVNSSNGTVTQNGDVYRER